MLRQCFSNKISASELRRKFIKSALLLVGKQLCVPPLDVLGGAAGAQVDAGEDLVAVVVAAHALALCRVAGDAREHPPAIWLRFKFLTFIPHFFPSKLWNYNNFIS